MKETEPLHLLIEELTELRDEMIRQEAALGERLREICPEHHDSARNLVHYMVLRRRDVRDLQERLTIRGLSSLGRAEPDVLGAVDAVLHVLIRLVGKPTNGAHPVQAQEVATLRGWDLQD